MYVERLPPHDVEAEEAVIGSIVIDPDAISRVAHFLAPEDFYNERNRWAYEAALAIFGRNDIIDQVTLSHELFHGGHSEGINMSKLAAEVPTSAHIEHYAGIVQRTAQMRRIIVAAGQIAAIGYNGGEDAEAALDLALSKLMTLKPDGGASVYTGRPLAALGFDWLEDRSSATPLGIAKLDRELGGGVYPGDFVIIGARTSMGKTALGTTIALAQKTPWLYVMLDMGLLPLLQRLISRYTGWGVLELRRRKHDYADDIMRALGAISELPLRVSRARTLAAIHSQAKAIKVTSGLGGIIVDHLGLVSVPGKMSEYEKVTAISHGMKEMGADLDIPVIGLVQMSRAVHTRIDKRPVLGDLRESGHLEQDAQVVLLPYFAHEDYPAQFDWEKIIKNESYPAADTMRVYIAKHQQGPRNIAVDLTWNPKIMDVR